MIIGFDASRINVREKTGVENYSTQLLHWFKKLDPSTSLLANKNQYILYTPDANDEEFSNLPGNFKIKEIFFPRLWTQIRLALQVFFDKPDIIFIPSHVMPFFVFRTKVVAVIHDVAFVKHPKSYSKFTRWYLDFTTRYTLKKAYKIITISQSTKNDLINIFGADKNKIEVVYMGFEGIQENKKITEQKNRFAEIKNKFGITKSYLFYLGRIESKKNIENLIKAFYELLSRGDDLQLVLAGKRGYGFEKIQRVIKEFNIEDKVIITGYISDEEKEYLFENASLFTFVSLYEGFGIPVLEAYSRGVPTVLSKIPVFEELFATSSILVDQNDYYKIAETILKLLNNKKKKEELIKKGKEKIKNFSWEKCARETLGVLEK